MSRNKMFDRVDFTQHSPASSASWLDEFATEWEKKATTAVEEARKRQSDSDYYSQISAILGGNKKHATVASIVEEYQELTGLKKYLKTLAEKEESQSKIKTAQQAAVTMDEDVTLKNFKPELKNKINTIIDNKIKSNYGYSSVPAIQNELLKLLVHDGVDAADVYNPEMVTIISKKLKEYKDAHPKPQEDLGNLGRAIIEVDEAQESQNNDFLSTLRTNKS